MHSIVQIAPKSNKQLVSGARLHGVVQCRCMPYFEAFFRDNWSLLQQAALYRPGTNPTFGNPDFETAALRVLIVRLSPFRDVNRSTPHLFLFQAVRRAVPGAYIDMAFFPPEHDRARMLGSGVPLLVGIQSWRDSSDFDLVLISNAYTLELINLPYLFHHSGIPLLSEERDGSLPVFVLGGSNAMATQAIITPEGDALVDAIFFGEGERQVESLVRAFYTHASLSKLERLARVAQSTTGLWVAHGLPEQVVRKAVCRDPTATDLLVDYPSLDDVEASTTRLQISFGCPAFCSFCFEGYDRKPYREVDLPAVLATADALKRTQGVEAVDVFSYNFNTYEQILTLLLELNRRFDRVNIQSQRVDLLAVMPSLIAAEVAADKRSYTLGVEGISRRMRAFLHKSLDDREIDIVLSRLMQERIREIKLFYILTGYESAADLHEFHEFVLELKELRRQHNRGLRVVFSFGLLIRMPFTPLSFDRLFLDEEMWRQIVGPAKSTCETNDFEFRLATSWDDYAVSQVLALGGRWLFEPLIELAIRGYCYDLELPAGYWGDLRGWMVARGLWNDAFLGEKGPDTDVPLDFVALDAPPGFLYRQYQQAQAGVDEGYCLGEVGTPGEVGEPGRCRACGACTTPDERAAITQHTMRHPGHGYLETLGKMMRAKWQTRPVYARVWMPPSTASAEAAWRNGYAMRAFLSAHPQLGDTLLSVRESLFTTKGLAGRYIGQYGETVLALKAWDVSILGQLLATGDELPGGVRFLGFLDEFAPGVFERLRLHLTLPSEHFPEAGQRLRQYLQAEYVPVNIRGTAAGYVLDIPEKARKKRIIFAGRFSETDGRFSAELQVSPKFDLLAYLRTFSNFGRYREATVEVRDLVL